MNVMYSLRMFLWFVELLYMIGFSTNVREDIGQFSYNQGNIYALLCLYQARFSFRNIWQQLLTRCMNWPW